MLLILPVFFDKLIHLKFGGSERIRTFEYEKHITSSPS
ncbi:MAG: hypothetical protein MRECE_17c001 [Mycoplasmataceae bacterium CE_OT135]|nr:MAG: hypothetical protein MRECE_17c001 [Mycoplasmataceae bacterium CE_OT135]